MNILYFLFFVSPIYHKYDIILSKNNANLDFKDNQTSVSFKYYKKILEERKERKRYKRHKEIIY